eukprot:TRINITY_DN19472_c0_g1_i1.p2 TRINITY_DN19472_c0_g1~~TRINITY_DN19472_c0_g1_i1.p2  ORF type:complete len:122 (+),score=12.93 TRINITY_DN19472_c0_g1_i1:232-597(+)
MITKPPPAPRVMTCAATALATDQTTVSHAIIPTNTSPPAYKHVQPSSHTPKVTYASTVLTHVVPVREWGTVASVKVDTSSHQRVAAFPNAPEGISPPKQHIDASPAIGTVSSALGKERINA